MTGAELRAWRIDHAWHNQAAFGRALATALGRTVPIHATTIWRWENGKGPPPDWLPLALERMENTHTREV